MRARIVLFIALLLTAITLIPAGAHVFEMYWKLQLGRDEYFVVQGIYRGWALFGIPSFGALLACLALAALVSRGRRLLALLAAAGLAGYFLIFFSFVYPANQATGNWTVQPENWDALRQSWEYGHTGAAACVFAAFLALASLAVFATPGDEKPRF